MPGIREQVKAFDDLKYEDVEAFGTTIRVRGLNGAEREQFEIMQWVALASQSQHRYEPAHIRATVIQWAAVDPATGEPIFGPGDIAWLARKSGLEIDKLYDAVDRLSGLTRAGVARIEKNSLPLDDDSGT